MKEFQKVMHQEFHKLKDNSRRTKSAFKREVRRRLSETDSEAAIDNKSMTNNVQLLQEAGDLLAQLESIIKERGLNLSATHGTDESQIEYPTFSGQDLPLVGDFLAEIEGLLIDSGVPVSGRGSVLAQSLTGHAKHILSNLEHNPSFESQAEILRRYFGEAGTQMNLVLRLHKSHGVIPSSHDLGQSMSSIHNIVKNHMNLLKAASSLHTQHTNGTLAENPITASYLNALEMFLPRTKREAICDAMGYKTSNTADRFKKICESYHQIQHFASQEIAKHGYDSDQPKLKQQSKHPHLAVQLSTLTPGIPQVDISPSLIQIPLPQTKPRHTRPMSKAKTKTFPFCTVCHCHHSPGQHTPQPSNQTYGSALSSSMSPHPVPTMSMTSVSNDEVRQQATLKGLYYS